jgi:myo-inositol-1-phosphate synthase
MHLTIDTSGPPIDVDQPLEAPPERMGLWLVGAAGNVGTTAAVGLAALQRGLSEPTGLITARPEFSSLRLRPLSRIIIGGHEIRRTTPFETAKGLSRKSGLFGDELLRQVHPDLEALSENICVGTGAGISRSLTQRCNGRRVEKTGASARAVIDRLRDDLRSFKRRNHLERIVVINVASTEPDGPSPDCARSWSELDRSLQKQGDPVVPASCLYAIAAIEEGSAYVNFTPSCGCEPDAIRELATARRVAIMGSDGKTGETLIKSALAPMFRDRNLEILSWTGYNILGNLDGMVLNDPACKSRKVRTKRNVVEAITGYRSDTKVSIEYVESLDDWKVAWDHVHFRGFLGTRMNLQFTWQGADSILAAPLIIDLARLADYHVGQGGTGVMTHLSCFFKSPMDATAHDLPTQVALLHKYALSCSRGRRPGRAVIAGQGI